MMETENVVLAVDIRSGSEIGVQLQNEGILDAEIKLLYIKNGEKEIASYISQKVKPDLEIFVEENKLEMTGLLCETHEIAAEAVGNMEEAALIQEVMRQNALEIEQAVTDVAGLKDLCIDSAATVEANAQAAMVSATDAAAQAEKSLVAKSQAIEAASNSQHWAEISQSTSGVCYLLTDGGVIMAKENDEFLITADGIVKFLPSVTVAFPVGRDEKFRNRSEIYTHDGQLFLGIYDSSGGAGDDGGFDEINVNVEVKQWGEPDSAEMLLKNMTITKKTADPRCVFLKRSISENNEYKYKLEMYYFLGKHHNSDVPELPISKFNVYCYYNIDLHQYYIQNTDLLNGGGWMAAVLCPLGYLDSGPSSHTKVICFPTYSLVTTDVWAHQQDSMVGTLVLSPLDSLDGYLLCNGAAITRAAYNKLYTVLGVKYGSGNGSSTFNIPDFRGDFLRGYLSGTSAAIGSRQNEGLPDAWGAFTSVATWSSGTGEGMMKESSNIGNKSSFGAGGGAYTKLQVKLSLGNAIYGANSHVTPRNNAINYFIKY